MVRQADPVFPDRELFAADMPTPPATTQSAGEASHAPMSPSQFAGDFLASAGIHGSDFMLGDDQPPFTTAGDTSLTMDELASFGLSLGINLADMQQDFSLPPTSIPNPLSPANSWSPTASGGANYDGTTGHAMGMGPMASGLPVSTADFASLPVEHQMALLQQPDFMSNFVQGGPPSVMAPVAQRPVSPLEIAQPGSPMRTASASPKRPASRNRTRRGQAGESVGSIRRSPATFQKSGVMVAPDSGVMLDEAIEDAERTVSAQSFARSSERVLKFVSFLFFSGPAVASC